MKIAGFGCGALGVLLGLSGVAAFALLALGMVNSAETGTAAGIGSSLCCSAFLPLAVGIGLVMMSRKKADAAE